ncbi:MAG: nitroreductase family protein [Alphaproteobacteria bacterium]|nr:nitroreductase family protein [Alphaproteobacteria bacterium]
MKKLLLVSVISCFSLTAWSADIVLPEALKSGGKPLMSTLAERRTIREFDQKELDKQTLSNLLWSAWGISSADGKRTIPTARNMQNLDVYVVLSDGTYLYDAQQNKLQEITKTDVRPLIVGEQKFAMNAPVHLLFVAEKDPYGSGAMHAGSAYQNVSLFCASAGLNQVVRGMINRNALHQALNLPAEKQVLISQAIGYPVLQD